MTSGIWMQRRSRLAALALALLPAGCVVTQPLARLKLVQGEAALSRQNLDLALVEFREAVKLDPQYA